MSRKPDAVPQCAAPKHPVPQHAVHQSAVHQHAVHQSADHQHDEKSYITELVTQVSRRVVYLKGLTPSQRDDIGQMTLTAFWLDADSIRARYPVPGIWAGQKLTGMAIDFSRREAAQRGQGARFTRQVDAFDPTDPATHAMVLTEHDPLEQLLASEELAPLLEILTPDDQALVCLVHGLGYSNREAAGILGISDSCASRRLSSSLARMREFDLAA